MEGATCIGFESLSCVSLHPHHHWPLEGGWTTVGVGCGALDRELLLREVFFESRKLDMNNNVVLSFLITPLGFAFFPHVFLLRLFPAFPLRLYLLSVCLSRPIHISLPRLVALCYLRLQALESSIFKLPFAAQPRQTYDSHGWDRSVVFSTLTPPPWSSPFASLHSPFLVFGGRCTSTTFCCTHFLATAVCLTQPPAGRFPMPVLLPLALPLTTQEPGGLFLDQSSGDGHRKRPHVSCDTVPFLHSGGCCCGM